MKYYGEKPASSGAGGVSADDDHEPAVHGSELLCLAGVRQLFGGRDYAAIWSVVISCSSVASFLSTPGWGMVYDTFGTYTPALALMPVIQLAAIAALLTAFRGKK